MVLTQSRTTSSNQDAFPTLQLFVLAICRLAEPVALASCFPYAYPMVKNFHVGDVHNASLYAGIFISAFALAESLTGLFWGGFSDRVGRKPVLLCGCAGTMVSMLIVGFSTNFWVALAGRAMGGLLNGNIGVIQTMVGEMITNPAHEPRAYAVMPFVWSIGTIIGPAIGGTLANPVVSLPSLFSSDSIFAKFPYLLPNIICAALLLISMVAGYFLLEETHPDLKNKSLHDRLETDTSNATTTPLITVPGTAQDSGTDLRTDNYGTFNTVSIQEEKQWIVNADGSSRPASVHSSDEPKIWTRQILMIVIALSLFSYHSMTYDHLLPIFLQDETRIHPSTASKSLFDMPGGIGLTTTAVGLIMSINGVIALFIQAVIFPLFASWMGIWKLFIMVTLLHPIEYFIVPILATLSKDLVYPGIYVCLTVRNFTSILAYPLLLILLKEACPASSVLGKINGLAASAGAASRTIAPPVAGYLYGVGMEIVFTGLAWWGSGVVAIIGAAQVFMIGRQKNKTAIVEAALPHLIGETENNEVVHIVVLDNEGYSAADENEVTGEETTEETRLLP